MISRWLPLTLCVAVFAPGLLHAQQTDTPIEVKNTQWTDTPFVLKSVYKMVDTTDYNKMYEDVEILRRILDRKLTTLYPSHTCLTAAGMMGMGGGMMGQGGMMGMDRMNMVVPVRSMEGVYLKSQGVIYTATLSSLQLPTNTEKTRAWIELWRLSAGDGLQLPTNTEKTRAAAERSANDWSAGLRLGSEWERVRRQVRNEKEEPKKPEATKPPELSDVLLRTLMENGEHFSQLGENESLTIVITVRETSPSSSGPELPSVRPPMKNELATKLRDLELLADLHLKQAEYKEALEEYTKTLELHPSAELHRKLAQCYLGLNQMEKARTEVDRAIEFSKKSQDAKDKPKPVAALPVKLIVSASKKLLDEAKGGKIPFEELRRKAHVETLKFDVTRR